MATDYGKLSPGRRRVLAVVMLAVLGVAVLAAWSLQAPADRRIRAAVALLEEARAASAGELWPETLRIDWYLVDDGAGITGWQAVVRGRADDGRFLGAEVNVVVDSDPARGYLSVEQWQLSPGLTAGGYRAAWRGRGGVSLMNIVLKNGMVTVGGANVRALVNARNEAPATYLPEGTSDLMARRVAMAGADAQFLRIINDRQGGGMVRFDTIRMRSVGRQSNEAGKQVDRVRVTGLRTGRDLDQVLEFDRDGTILRRLDERSGTQWARADMEEVVKHYPEAPVLLLRQLEGDLGNQVGKLLLGRLKRPLPENGGPKEQVSI